MQLIKDRVKSLLDKIKQNRKLEFVIYGVIILVIIVIYFSSFQVKEESKNEQSHVTQEEITFSELAVEQRLEKALSSIRGAGKVEVMITYETGPEMIPAMSIDRQENNAESSSGTTQNRTESTKPATVSVSGGNEPIVLTERQPTIRGVIVIAEGAADITVQMDLILAAKTVLGVSLDCIEVFEMTGE